jgi:hypothetical protein
MGKLIDDKGRLFGFINVVDLAIIIILTVLAGGLVYYRTGAGRRFLPKSQGGVVEATLVVSNVRTATVDAIQVGDMVMESKSNLPLGEIIWKEVKPAEIVAQGEDGRFYETTSQTRKDVWLKLSGQGAVSPNAITLGSSEIRIGTPINIKTRLYAVETRVMAIDVSKVR